MLLLFLIEGRVIINDCQFHVKRRSPSGNFVHYAKKPDRSPTELNLNPKPDRALSKTNEPHGAQSCHSCKQVFLFLDAGDMLHQLDPPKGSTWSEFVLQEPNRALSKTNEPHGAQSCHSCKQVVLFLIAGNMLHQLDPPKGSTWSEFVLQEPNGALSKTNEPHGAQARHSCKQVVLFGDARDMLHQLDPPKGSTWSEFVLQEPNRALSKTNEPHGAQSCHSCKQVVLFLIAGNMLHQLDPPKGSTWSEFVLQEPNGALSKTNEPHGAQARHSCKQVVLFGDARDMKHQLDPPKRSTWSDIFLQERTGALSRTNEPRGSQPSHSCTQIVLFGDARDMKHQLDTPQKSRHGVGSYSRNQMGLSQRQMSPMGHKPAIAISKYFCSQMLETCCTSWTLQKGRQRVNSYSRNQMGLSQRQMSPMGHKPAIAVSKVFCF